VKKVDRSFRFSKQTLSFQTTEIFMRLFVRGDIDGFFGLALDNLVQLLVIDALCRFVLGFPTELIYGRILPGVAVSLLVGNIFYSWQALQLARASGRDDVCALPYGINTVSLFAYVFLVMLPAKLVAEAAGAADPARIAWQAGLLACVGSGLIELTGAFFAERLRRATQHRFLVPRLCSTADRLVDLGDRRLGLLRPAPLSRRLARRFGRGIARDSFCLGPGLRAGRPQTDRRPGFFPATTGPE
jgi:adenine/guanine/hypoxanthine permease